MENHWPTFARCSTSCESIEGHPMHVFVTPAAQDKLPSVGVFQSDLERVIFQGAKRRISPDGTTSAILRDLEVKYREEGDDMLVLDVSRRNATGVRGTSSPF